MATISTGLTLQDSSDSVFFAEVLDVQGPGASRESIPTSHMGTESQHTFTPADLVDWGELSVELAFDPSTSPPIDQGATNWSIEFADGSTWHFQGFMTAFSPGAPLEQRMTASATVKITGGITIT